MIAAQVFMLAAIPFARSVPVLEDGENKDKKLTEQNAAIKILQQQTEKEDFGLRWVTEKAVDDAQRRGIFVAAAVLGIVALVGGNAFAGTVFGKAWAKAVAGEYDPWDQQKLNQLADYLYDMNLGALLSILAGGLVFGTVIGRWLIDSFSCDSFLIFGLWLVFATAPLCQ